MPILNVRRVAGGFVVYDETTRKVVSDVMKKGEAFSEMRERQNLSTTNSKPKPKPKPKKKTTKKPPIFQTENIVKPGYWVKIDGKKTTEKRTKGMYKNIPVVE